MHNHSPSRSPWGRPLVYLQTAWRAGRQGLLTWMGGLRFVLYRVHQVSARPLRWLAALLIVGGLSSIIAEYGFALIPPLIARIHAWQVYVIWGYFGIFFLRLILAPHRWVFLQQHKMLAILWVLILLKGVVFHLPLAAHGPSLAFRIMNADRVAEWSVALMQGFILLLVVFEGTYIAQKVATWQIRPAQALTLSFLTLIVLGCLLLMLPRATSEPGAMSFLQALFTATSAVCVTGLIVVDTATFFTPLGQGIIIGLCQLGGLGIITFATVIGMMVRGNIGIREKLLFQDLVASRQFGQISTMVRRIVGLTLLLEACGAVSLFYHWQNVLPDANSRLWHAVFHAISAFCNAGFSTFSNNLVGMADASQVGAGLTVIGLIILGGLGFSVVWEVGRWIGSKMTGRVLRVSMQSRLVLLVSALLIGLGAVLLALLESDGVLAGRTVGQQLFETLFQSVTARTAGFNTLPIDAFSIPATVLLGLLMLIGASPGSTGGGMKTTTVAVLFLTTMATIRGKARVEIFRRTLPWSIINQAYATFFFAIAFITLSLFILSMTESAPFVDLFFEEVSAFATVGLSRGITSSLSNMGQVVIIVSMFVGRVGSLTLGVALAQQVTTTAYEYPTESVMVG